MPDLDGEKYTDINAKTIDRWVQNGWTWGIPITHEDYEKAKNGEWNVVLTASKYVPKEWFPPLKDKKILGLAAGGGQQMPVFSALGACCTALDYSETQLASEKLVAEREQYSINIVKADMSERFPFDEDTFDIIFHPVSNCYVEDVFHIWKECFRVLKTGGILMAGMDNGINFLFEDIYKRPLTVVNTMPFNPLKDRSLYHAEDGFQFSHSITEQIGGQIKAGFVLTGLYEDMDTDGLPCEYNIPQYIATRAVKQ